MINQVGLNYHGCLDKKIIISSKNFVVKQEYIIRFYETKIFSTVSLLLSAFNSVGSDTTKSNSSYAHTWSDVLTGEKSLA